MGIVAFIDVPLIFTLLNSGCLNCIPPQVGQYFDENNSLPTYLILFSFFSFIIVSSFMIRFRIHTCVTQELWVVSNFSRVCGLWYYRWLVFLQYLKIKKLGKIFRMERKIIHVIGTGTIGEPLIGLLCDYRDQLGIDGITFKKEVASETDKSKVIDLIKRGARLVTDQDKINEFKKLNLDPAFESDEAIKRATVVIDCSTKSNQISSKKEYYNDFKNDVKGFIIQGDQNGFGKKYAYGINDSALDQSEIYSSYFSNHNISSITNTLAFN